jgi:hypothetical protein
MSAQIELERTGRQLTVRDDDYDNISILSTVTADYVMTMSLSI